MWDTVEANKQQQSKTKPSSYRHRWGRKIPSQWCGRKLPKLRKDTPLQIQEAQRTSNRQDQIIKFPGYLTVETLSIHNRKVYWKLQEKEHKSLYKGKPIRVTADFSLESLRGWSNVLHIPKTMDGPPTLTYPAKLATVLEGERKHFHNINSLKTV